MKQQTLLQRMLANLVILGIICLFLPIGFLTGCVVGLSCAGDYITHI
mgnify:CR=1 FL=1